MTLLLTPGQQHEATVFEPLMEQGTVARRHGGRPKLRPRRVIGDKAYSSKKIREYIPLMRFLCYTVLSAWRRAVWQDALMA